MLVKVYKANAVYKVSVESKVYRVLKAGWVHRVLEAYRGYLVYKVAKVFKV